MRKFFTILVSALIALIFVSEAVAQIRRGHDKVVELTTQEASEMWGKFKSARIAGDYAMGFIITHSPRRGENVEYVGEIFGTRRGDETLTRIRVKKVEPKNSPVSDFILSNSNRGGVVWKAQGDKFVEVPKADWFKPLVEGLIYSPFDLLMPYTNWQAVYVGGGRIGQAVYFFDLVPPTKDIAKEISRVRIAITREFNSPAQTEIFDAKGDVVKKVSLGAVKKFDGVWLVRQMFARDEKSRDKDKLEFRSASVRTIIDSSVFDATKKPVEPPRIELKRL